MLPMDIAPTTIKTMANGIFPPVIFEQRDLMHKKHNKKKIMAIDPINESTQQAVRH